MSGSVIANGQNLTYNGNSVSLDSSWEINSVDDFNGDGKADILLRKTSGSFVDWTLGGSAITAADNVTFAGNPVALDSSWSVAGTADFNGDENADILRRNTNGSFVDWTMGGSAIIAADNLTFGGMPVALDSSWSVVDTADFNGDGNADILLRNSANDGFVDWTMKGAAIVAANNLTFGGRPVGIDNSWSVLGTGDFIGDGKVDVLLRNTNGTVADWTMDGSAITAAQLLTFQGNPVAIDTSWTFADISDYNGDGKADILLRNTNGSFVEWAMNGSTIAAAQNLTFNGTPVFLDNSWQT